MNIGKRFKYQLYSCIEYACMVGLGLDACNGS